MPCFRDVVAAISSFVPVLVSSTNDSAVYYGEFQFIVASDILVLLFIQFNTSSWGVRTEYRFYGRMIVLFHRLVFSLDSLNNCYKLYVIIARVEYYTYHYIHIQ